MGPRRSRSKSNKPRETRRLVFCDEVAELGEIWWRDVGDGAEREAVLLPGEPVVALGFAGTIPVVFRLSLFHKDINDVLAASVDQRGDGFSAGYIKPAAEEREAVVREIVDG